MRAYLLTLAIVACGGVSEPVVGELTDPAPQIDSGSTSCHYGCVYGQTGVGTGAYLDSCSGEAATCPMYYANCDNAVETVTCQP